jgi:hypothetical protein
LRVKRYGGDIMMARTQITLDAEIQRRARQRANDMGISLAEYVRRLLLRDLDRPQAAVSPAAVFDLGTSRGSDIATEKDRMIAEAFSSHRGKTRR